MVLLLRGRDGAEFELAIVGPGPTTKLSGAWPGLDLYWVEVQARVSTLTQTWTFSGESLDNQEVGILADWLGAVGNRREVMQELEFLDPDFSFRILEDADDDVVLRVYFELRGRPPWAPANSAGRRDVWIDLRVSRADLRAAADMLVQDASQLPHGESLKGV